MAASSSAAAATTMYSAAPPPSLLPGLPDDVALQCIARVPRYHHPTISLVSKSWNSILRSPRLYTTRSNLRCTEHFIYLYFNTTSSNVWCHHNPGGHIGLPPLPQIPSVFRPLGPAVAVLGTKFYVMGGIINSFPSNSVWVFDCRFNKWDSGPKMRASRKFAGAAVANGKIYVMGGCSDGSMISAEVFDPMTRLWEVVPSPMEVMGGCICAVMDDKVYAKVPKGGAVFDAMTAEWREIPKQMDLGLVGSVMPDVAVVDGVLYGCDAARSRKIIGYIMEENAWKELKGIDNSCGFITMVNLCGNLCLLSERVQSGAEAEIMCTMIKVWKDEEGGLSGSILWSGMIVVLPHQARTILGLAQVVAL